MKNTRMSNLTKIRRVGAELIHADGQTDKQTGMKKLVVAFLKLAKASSN
jgi:hypothetical protein